MHLGGLGLRPDALIPSGQTARTPAVRARVEALADAALAREGATHVTVPVIAGFAEAVATAAQRAGLPTTLLVPYRGIETTWFTDARRRLERLLADATTVQVVSARGVPVRAQIEALQSATIAACETLLLLSNGQDDLLALAGLWRQSDRRSLMSTWGKNLVRTLRPTPHSQTQLTLRIRRTD